MRGFMRKPFILLIVAAAALTGVVSCSGGGEAAAPGGGAPAAGRAGGAGGRAGRPPMPVEFTTVKRAPVAEQILVVGNLIGAATVQVVPKVNGRLEVVTVKLGDTVRRGQLLAKVEDQELQQQVRQADASFEVSKATIRQREADLKLAASNLDRNKSLLDRQLLPQQTYEDTEARHQAAVAQLDLARAQFQQASSRLDELKITLANTSILSPVDGFVGKRFLDPGAFVGPNSPVASVVDIHTVRMVANLVEKDSKRVPAGTAAAVEVDAFPGEKFAGRVSRVAPVFDPSTRTAEMEIEIPNPSYRLKPGMYARVHLTVQSKADALTVPRNAVIEVDGKPGVFIASGLGGGQRTGQAGQGPAPASSQPPAQNPASGQAAMTAKFLPVQTGIRDGEHVEIVGGIQDGAQVITTGAGALKDGDRIVAAIADGGRDGAGAGANREGGGQRQGSNR